MKRLLLAILLVALVALPAAAGQVTVFVPDESSATGWSSLSQTEPAALARAWNSVPALNRSCDKKEWTETFVNHASVTQWINYTFGGTRWDWQVRKPGTFAADCIEFTIQSNDDVIATFAGFADLASQVHQGYTIPVSYGFGDMPENVSEWVAAEALNSRHVDLPYDAIKAGTSWKLWNRIVVSPDTRACNYEDSGVITLTLTDVKDWVDPADGEFLHAVVAAN